MPIELGTDLVVVPQLRAHDAAETDLVARTRPATRVRTSGLVDLQVISDRENLAQALILRLLTPLGSLTSLGHASYGSRLHQLIGREKTEAVRNLCRAFVLEVVAQEPRVEDTAVSFAFEPDAEDLSSLVFTLEVRPREGGEPLGLSLEVAI